MGLVSSRDYTDGEAAVALGKHVRSVQRYCAAGLIEGAHKQGRKWRIPPAGLRRFQLRDQGVEDPVLGELRAANEAIVHLGERLDVWDGDLEEADQELRQLVTVALATIREIEAAAA